MASAPHSANSCAVVVAVVAVVVGEHQGQWRFVVEEALGWLGRRQASHTIARARERDEQERRGEGCLRQRGNSKQASAPISLGAYGIPYVSSSILLYRSAITSFICALSLLYRLFLAHQPMHTAIARCYRCDSLLQTQYHTTKLPLPALLSSLKVTYILSRCVSRSKQASSVVRVRRCEAVYGCQLLTLLLARYTSS